MLMQLIRSKAILGPVSGGSLHNTELSVVVTLAVLSQGHQLLAAKDERDHLSS